MPLVFFSIMTPRFVQKAMFSTVTNTNIRNRLCVSIASWYYVPGQGMKELEVLCRASGFLIKSSGNVSKFKPKYHIVTVTHVAAPFRCTIAFPEEFLRFVSEKHVTYSAEIRKPDGSIICSTDLAPSVYHHGGYDLSVLHFDPKTEGKAVRDFQKLGLCTDLSLCEDDVKAMEYGTPLECHGHEIVGEVLNTSSEVDRRLAMPNIAYGHKCIQDPEFDGIFAKTVPEAENGMCGGPVILTEPRQTAVGDDAEQRQQSDSKSSGRSSKFTVAGMVMGKAFENHSIEELRGATGFVEAREIQKFLTEIENGAIKPKVCGGIVPKNTKKLR